MGAKNAQPNVVLPRVNYLHRKITDVHMQMEEERASPSLHYDCQSDEVLDIQIQSGMFWQIRDCECL